VLGLLPLVAFLGAGFDLGAGLGKLRQTLLTARQFVRDRHTVRNIGLIRGFGPRQQFGHFGLQLRLDLAGVLIGQCAVPAGIGMDLRAVERHGAHLEHPHLARQRQHLHEQSFDLLEKSPSKRRDRVVVGMVVRSDEAEGHRIVRRPLQLPARKHARRVAVHQNAQQQRRMVGGRSRAPVALAHRREVQPVNHFDNKARQVPLRQPFIHGWRQEKSSVAVNLAEIAHGASHPGRGNGESMRRF
jgi:hypothetical protein